MNHYSISLFTISKQQTIIIKAIAIILVVLHNFLHWTNNIGENEYQFNSNRIISFLDSIQINPTIFLNAILSYWGHYGVQLFIFVSGYGLAKQYSTYISYKTYIVPKLIKIYSLLLFGLIIYILFFFSSMSIGNIFRLFTSTLLMYNNFSYSTLFRFAYIGPWWYFSLIFQLYVIFPILYHFLNKENKKEKYFMTSILISYLLIYILFPITEKYNIPLFGNFVGHLPEFLFGIYVAISSKFRLSITIVILALCLFILSNIYNEFFPLSFLSITLLLLAIYYPIYSRLNRPFSKLLLFIGNVSPFMFIINGPIRAITIRFCFGKSEIIIFSLSIIHLMLVIIISSLLKLMYEFLRREIENVLLNKKR